MSTDVTDAPAPVTTILFLAANPQGTAALRLDREVREIEAGLRRSQYRSQFVLKQQWAVRPRDVQQALMEVNPQIVHFSGHGEGEPGLTFEDDAGKPKFVDAAALAGLFELFADQVTCVLLNACYSSVQAEAIRQHIPYVIGMNRAIGDRAALEFAVGFYDALGAGRSIEFAYKAGCSAIRMAGSSENQTPELISNPLLNPERKAIPVSVSPPISVPSPVSDEITTKIIATPAETPTLAVAPVSKPALTARQRQRIEQELDSLQQQLNLINQRLDRLRQAFAVETDPAMGFKLEKQIEQTEAERSRIQQQMEELEHKLSS